LYSLKEILVFNHEDFFIITINMYHISRFLSVKHDSLFLLITS
jgi:hypothetical protein